MQCAYSIRGRESIDKILSEGIIVEAMFNMSPEKIRSSYARMQAEHFK